LASEVAAKKKTSSVSLVKDSYFPSGWANEGGDDGAKDDDQKRKSSK